MTPTTSREVLSRSPTKPPLSAYEREMFDILRKFNPRKQNDVVNAVRTRDLYARLVKRRYYKRFV